MAKYKPALDNDVKKAITEAAAAIQAIPQPFRNNINSKESSTAIVACANLATVLELELKPFLQNNTK